MKQWYILQLVAGNEEKVKNEIERRVKEKNLYEFFDEIFIIPAIPNKIILISRIRLNVNP